ncbi:7648_t:CDS:2, partial [Acaulospora colombiana]
TGIIHGDIKADNCLLRLEPTFEWDSRYDPSGAHGWSKKGIKLIDFGCAVDVTKFSPDMRFIADWKTDDQDCVEMREGRPWKWQADYYGLAGVIHCMLHNEYMQITPVRVDDDSFSSGVSSISTKKYRPIQSFKRYWQSDLWRKLFDMLLNPTMVRSDSRLPITQELNDIRREFEEYLVSNSNRAGKNLKELLYKLEISGEHVTGYRYVEIQSLCPQMETVGEALVVVIQNFIGESDVAQNLTGKRVFWLSHSKNRKILAKGKYFDRR